LVITPPIVASKRLLAAALYKKDLSHSYGGIGESLFALGRVVDGAESYHKAIAIRKEHADADPKNLGIRLVLPRGYFQLGSTPISATPVPALESLGWAILSPPPIPEMLTFPRLSPTATPQWGKLTSGSGRRCRMGRMPQLPHGDARRRVT
jgi:hypothetical protein